MVNNRVFKQQVYESPRMSLKLICEYVTASASRRSTIIKDSCIVPTFIAKRYNLASQVVSSYISRNETDLNVLKNKVRAISTKRYKTQNEIETAMLCVEAITAFSKHANSVTSIFNGFNVEMCDQFSSQKMNIEGVDISVRPELIIRNPVTNKITGFIKLYFSKTTELDEITGDLITCLGRNYFNETHNLNLEEKNCFVLDVFRGELATAPRAFK